MYFIALPKTIVEQIINHIRKLDYDTAQPLLDNIIYCSQNYCWDDEQQTKPNPVGFQINNEVNIDVEEDDTDDTM